MRSITVGIKRVGQMLEFIDVKLTLESLQLLIGCGYVQLLMVKPGICIVCDEDGLLKQLPFNFHVFDQHQGVHKIHGDALVVRQTGSNFTSLSEQDMAWAREDLE